MGLLSAKLLDLYDTDSAVRVKLDAVGAIVKDPAPGLVKLDRVDSDTMADVKARVHKDYADSLGGSWSFLLKDGRTVTVEATRIGVMARDEKTGLIVFRQRADGGAHPVFFRINVDGKYLNDDGWYGFVNASTMVPDGTTSKVTDEFGETHDRCNWKEDVGAALERHIADVLGGSL